MSSNPKPKGGLVAYLTVEGAIKAGSFYEKAFGAETVLVIPPDERGRTMHVHLYVNGSSLMLSDPYPDHGHPFRDPAGFNLTLMVEDVDSWFDRAIKAGCTATQPPSNMFWGDRYAALKDPFGVAWAINGPVRK
ncbi:MAG: glyoxalase/bleomycin resistance/extradiol dioxygenase family protein [Proteobacteria bacterium]|nr:glyoxalase/bleomycin resistance/extradiol dioxygenase family protein [Pseudomonadota bacterium]